MINKKAHTPAFIPVRWRDRRAMSDAMTGPPSMSWIHPEGKRVKKDRPPSHQPFSAAPPRSLDTGLAFWCVMFLASAFGTNLGDFWVDGLALSRPVSFASLVIVCGLAIWGDRRLGLQTELCYWIAVVALRAAATNLADFLTHDLGLSYVLTTSALGAAGLLAGYKTRPSARCVGSPLIDGRYWIAMLLAGLFGTVGGDLTSHTMGLYAAAGSLTLVLILVLGIRSQLYPTAILAYWCTVLAERSAATPVGDALASRHALGLGLQRAMLCTCALFMLSLGTRWIVGRAMRKVHAGHL